MVGGFGAMETSSWMVLLSLWCVQFFAAGDELLCIGGFCDGTYSLVNKTLVHFGVNNSFCEVDDFAPQLTIDSTQLDLNEAPRPKGARYLHSSKFNCPS